MRGSNDIVTRNQVIESGLFGGGMDVITKFTLIMSDNDDDDGGDGDGGGFEVALAQ